MYISHPNIGLFTVNAVISNGYLTNYQKRNQMHYIMLTHVLTEVDIIYFYYSFYENNRKLRIVEHGLNNLQIDE